MQNKKKIEIKPVNDWAKNTKNFYEGLRNAKILIPRLNYLTLKMVSKAEHMEAAREDLAVNKIRLDAVTDQLKALTRDIRRQTRRLQTDSG